MTVVVSQPSDVTLQALERVALGGEDVVLAPDAVERMSRAHDEFQHYVDTHQNAFIYGVTSGYGPAGKDVVALDETRERRRRGSPWLGLAFGGGDLPEYVSRASVFAMLPMLVSGNTAAHPARVAQILESLRGRLRCLPSRGLVAAGELMPNFILHPDVGGEPLPGEGFAAGMRNGSQTSNGMAALAAIFARRRLALVERAFALSVEAFNAPLDAYSSELEDLWGDRFEARALRSLRTLLEGGAAERRPYQAPVSYRILPRVLGQAHRAVSALEEVASVSLREVASNPTFVRPTDSTPGLTLSTGGYHNATGAPAIDAVAATWVDLAGIAHRHIVKLHKGAVSLLPDRLLPAGSDYTTAYSTTYLEYVPNHAIEEMRRIAGSTLLTAAEVAASEQDDIGIATPVAFTLEREVARRFDEVLAVLLVVASQAFAVTERTAPDRLAALHRFIVDAFPPVASRRQLGEECGRLAERLSAAIESGGDELTVAVEEGAAA